MNFPYRNNQFRQANNFGQRRNGQNQNRDMTGKLWQNTKSQHPKAPQMTGVCTIQGVQYFISAWFNHDPQRGDVVSLKLEPKQEQRRNSYQNGQGYSPNYSQQQGYPPQQRQQAAPYPRNVPNGNYSPPPQPNYWPNEAEPPAPNGPDDYGTEPDDEIPF